MVMHYYLPYIILTESFKCDLDLWSTSRSNLLPARKPQFSEFAVSIYFIIIAIITSMPKLVSYCYFLFVSETDESREPFRRYQRWRVSTISLGSSIRGSAGKSYVRWSVCLKIWMMARISCLSLKLYLGRCFQVVCLLVCLSVRHKNGVYLCLSLKLFLGRQWYVVCLFVRLFIHSKRGQFVYLYIEHYNYTENNRVDIPIIHLWNSAGVTCQYCVHPSVRVIIIGYLVRVSSYLIWTSMKSCLFICPSVHSTFAMTYTCWLFG